MNGIYEKLKQDYWLGKLEGVPGWAAPAGLPRYEFVEVLPARQATEFKGLGKNNPQAIRVLALAAFRAVLGRHLAGLGQVVASLPSPAESATQYFVLPYREADSLKSVVEQVRQQVQESQPYYPYEATELARRATQQGLHLAAYQAFGLFYDEDEPAADAPALAAGRFLVAIRPNADHSLTLTLAGDGGVLEPWLAQLFLTRFSYLLSTYREQLATPLARLRLAAPPALPVPEQPVPNAAYRPQTLVARFAQQARATPQAIALAWETGQLTYAELDTQSNQLAHCLLAHGLQPEEVVAAVLPKNPLVYLAFLGIMKAGGIYLPVAADYPEARIRYLLQDSEAAGLLSLQPLSGAGSPGGRFQVALETLDLAAYASTPVGPEPTPSQLAYCIYTSGSTGQPKGVLVEHHSLANLAVELASRFELTAQDRILQFASLSFDVSLMDMSMAWLAGATLVVPTQVEARDQPAMVRYMKAQGVTAVFLPPSYLDALTDDNLAGLTCLITGGEAAHREKALHCAGFLRYYNAYGPTECAACISVHRVTAADAAYRSIPIGQPLGNVQFRVLDENLEPVLPGLPGTLYVAGVALARGYHGKPALTAAAFIQHPQTGERLYNTGDGVRWLPGGELEFLGRTDEQVKIRGYRIELGEIENVLLAQPGVRQAAATVLSAADGSLAAYVVSELPLDVAWLRQQLLALLPDYLVPTHLQQLPALPLTPNGKVDKKALPPPDHHLRVAPRTPLEEELLQVWEEVLETTGVGVTDNFFLVGGHSIRATYLAARYYEKLGIKVPLRELFSAPTVEQQAAWIVRQPKPEEVALPDLVPLPPAPAYALSHAQKRMWVQSQEATASVAYNVPGAGHLRGPLSYEALQKALDALVVRHESLRTVFVAGVPEPQQQIVAPFSVGWEFQDFSATPAALPGFVQQFVARPFALATGPLFRVGLVRLGATHHVLVLVMHHIITDGWSMRLLVQDMGSLYSQFLAMPTQPAPVAPPVQYKEFAHWHNQQLAGTAWADDEAYWLRLFETRPPALDLPTDFDRAQAARRRSALYRRTLPPALWQALQALRQQQQLTTFSLLLAGLRIWLVRLSGQEEFCLGTVAANRDQAQSQSLIGFFANTLALRSRVPLTAAFLEVAQGEQASATEALLHQNYPFDRLIDRLSTEQPASRLSLFDVMVVLNSDAMNAATGFAGFTDLAVEAYEVDAAINQFDLAFHLNESAATLEVAVEFNQELFQAATVANWVEQWLGVLAQATSNPALTVQAFHFDAPPPVLPLEVVPVLDAYQRPLPAGLVGKLAGSATGQRARRLLAGGLELLDAQPAQTLVAGRLVETAAIESVARRLPGVRDACLLYHKYAGRPAYPVLHLYLPHPVPLEGLQERLLAEFGAGFEQVTLHPHANFPYDAAGAVQIEKLLANRLLEASAAANLQHQLQQAVAGLPVLVRNLPAGADYQVGIYQVVAGDNPNAEELLRLAEQPLQARGLTRQFFPLEALPLDSSGHLQWHLLPTRAVAEHQAAETATPAQRAMLELWQAVLRQPHVGLYDNFFELGGHSLSALQLISKVQEAWGMKLSLLDIFSHPTPLGFTNHLVRLQASAEVPIAPVALADDYPLSHAQRRLWILEQLEDEQSAYVVPASFWLHGVEPERLARSFDALLERHEALRTVFVTRAGEPRQRILSLADVKPYFEVVDLRATPAAEAQAEARAQAEVTRKFALDQRNISVRLLRVADDRFLLLVSMHHIISDAISLQVLIRELTAAYFAAPEIGSALTVQYKDFVAWQDALLHADAGRTHRAFWHAQFASVPAPVALPPDRPRPAVKTYAGRTLEVAVPHELRSALREASRHWQATEYTILLTAVYTLLYRYTGQPDLVVGSPVAGRKHTQVQSLIGFFVNMLALVHQVEPERSFQQEVEAVRTLFLEAEQHQMYPFDRLVDELALPRDLSRSPLFDIAVSYNDTDAITQELAGFPFAIQELRPLYPVSKFDASFDFIQRDGGLLLSLEYNTDLFDDARMQTTARHLLALLRAGIAHPDTPVARLNLLTNAERATLLTWGQGNGPLPAVRQHPVLEWLAQVNTCSRREALCFEQQTYSYAEVGAQVNQLAHCLAGPLHLQPGQVVAVQMHKSARLPLVVWALWQAGGVLLPVAPDVPAARRQIMLAEGEAQYLLTDLEEPLATDLPPAVRVLTASRLFAQAAAQPTTFLARPLALEDVAYILYTSGSTGTPKGTLVTHQNLMSVSQSWTAAYRLQQPRVLQLASLGFDVFVGDLCRAWHNGGSLVMCPEAVRFDFAALLGLMQSQAITTFETTPLIAGAFFAYLRQQGAALPALQLVIVGSDTFPVAMYHQIRQQLPAACRLVNSFGATEATIDSSFFEAAATHAWEGEVVPIGPPLPNTRYYVADQHRNLLPPGQPGELCIGGQGIALGYLRRPELTAARFIANPWLPGERLYCTGDWVQWNAQGAIEFLGRQDRQVQLGGVRIELEEIERTLAEHPQVQLAAVRLHTVHGHPVLVAHLLSELQQASTLREYLAAQLPAAMIPAYYQFWDELPRTASGKVDAARLVFTPPALAPEAEAAEEAPQSETEKVVAALLAELIGQARLARTSNFFEVGGNSLKALQWVAHLNRHFGAQLGLRDVFQHPTVGQMAALLESSTPKPYQDILPTRARPDYPLSFAQQRLWLISQLNQADTSFNDPLVLRLTGPVAPHALAEAFRRLLVRHEILRTNYCLKEGEPRQKVQHAEQLKPFFELHECPDDPARVAALTRTFSQWVFDLEHDSLLQVHLLREGPEVATLLIVMHHIVSDARSTVILVQEVLADYQLLREGQPPQRPALPIQYRDYARWHNRYLHSPAARTHQQFWERYLAGPRGQLSLPTDFPRPAIRVPVGAVVAFEVEADLTEAIRRLCQQYRTTPFVFVLAALHVLLAQPYGETDLFVGSPVEGREHPQLQQLIGYFINVLPFRVRGQASESFATLLTQTHGEVMAALDHKNYPLEMMLDDLALPRDPSRTPLFDVNVVYNSQELNAATDLHAADLRITPVLYETGASKQDLKFGFDEFPGSIQGYLQYNTSLYVPDTARQLCTTLLAVMRRATTSPDFILPSPPGLTATAVRAQAARGRSPLARRAPSWRAGAPCSPGSRRSPVRSASVGCGRPSG